MRWMSVVLLLCGGLVQADSGPTLLITPRGVWQIDYEDDVPVSLRPMNYDVVIRGFGTGGDTDADPTPDRPVPGSPEVQAVAAISREVLRDSQEATSVYAIVETLHKSGLSAVELADRLTDFSGLLDFQLGSNGRLATWIGRVIEDVASPNGGLVAQHLLDGLRSAFRIDRASVDLVVSSSQQPKGALVAEEARDWTRLIETLRMILELIRSFRK